MEDPLLVEANVAEAMAVEEEEEGEGEEGVEVGVGFGLSKSTVVFARNKSSPCLMTRAEPRGHCSCTNLPQSVACGSLLLRRRSIVLGRIAVQARCFLLVLP